MLRSFDLLTGVFTLVPLALLDERRGVTVPSMPRNWGVVSVGDLGGTVTVALTTVVIVTTGFAVEPNEVGQRLGEIGEARTVGHAEFGAAGMLTPFIRAVLCDWRVSTGVVAAMMSTSVSGEVIAMWMPVQPFFSMGFEHSIVNRFLFPSGQLLGGDSSLGDHLVRNEIPTVLGDLVGGLTFVGLTLDATHGRTRTSRRAQQVADAQLDEEQLAEADQATRAPVAAPTSEIPVPAAAGTR